VTFACLALRPLPLDERASQLTGAVAQGWRLIGLDDGVAYFERPTP
jgi:hypothetical protein